MVERFESVVDGAAIDCESPGGFRLVEADDDLRDTHLAQAHADRAADLTEANDSDGSEIESSHMQLDAWLGDYGVKRFREKAN
jgi:hypothetical protein